MAKRRRKASTTSARSARTKGRRWSQRVTETSDAMTLEEGVFRKSNPRTIASSVKRSAERSRRRKSSPFRSAMSMLTFFVNRAGKGLSKSQRSKLEKAKDELRALFGKDEAARTKRKRTRSSASGRKAGRAKKRRKGR